MTESSPSAKQSSAWLRAAFLVLAVVGFAWWWWGGDEVAPPVPSQSGMRAEQAPAELAGSAATDQVRQASSREVIGEMAAGAWPLIVKVVDANGDPVAAAAVEVQESRRGAASIAARTNSDGICTLDVTSDRVLVRAHHSRIGRSLLVAATEDGYVDQQLRLLLWRPRQVTGVVLGADSRPWPGVGVRLEARELLYGASSPHVWPNEVVTDAAGRFAFEAAADVPGFARLSAPGFENVEAEWVASEGAQVVLAVPGALRIEGLVVDRAGNPISAVVVLASADDYRTQARTAVASERFSLEPKTLGTHTLSATGEGWLVGGATVELTAAQPRVYIEVKLEELERIPEPVAPTGPVLELDLGNGKAAGLQVPLVTPPVDHNAIVVEVVGADGKLAKGVMVQRASELGSVMHSNLTSSTSNHVTLRESQVKERPMRLLFSNRQFSEHGWLDLAEGPLPGRVIVQLGVRGSVSVEARCRGRVARGVMLQMWTHHEAFSSGRGKHHLEANEVPAGPALIEVRRGFELVGTKAILVQPGVFTSETIEVELK